MSQLEDINAIHEMFARSKPSNATANALKTSWISWFQKLRPYDKSSSPGTYQEAVRRRDAFFKADSERSKPSTPNTPSKPMADTPILIPGPRPTLRLGIHKTYPSYKPHIVEWQNVVKVTPDGLFGSGTEGATKGWQRARGLDADGVVGPKTWSRAQLESTQAMTAQTSSLPAAAAAAVDQIMKASQAASTAAAAQKTPAAAVTAAVQSATQSVNAAVAQAANAAAGKPPAPQTKPKPKPAAVKPPAISTPAMSSATVTEAVTALQSTISNLHARTPIWAKVVAVAGGALGVLIGIKAFSGGKRRAA